MNRRAVSGAIIGTGVGYRRGAAVGAAAGTVVGGAAGGIGAAIIGSAHYDNGAVLKLTRDCIMLGSSMRRVGLIDIMVGNTARLGAS
jgi:hypothetical protein